MRTSTAETEEDVQIIKDFTLLPILLDMLARDMGELKINKDKIIYTHVLYYLRDVEKSIYPELSKLKSKMRQLGIKVLKTETDSKGIHVEYKVRGYIHHFSMLRSLVKAELMTMLMKMRRELHEEE